jgi:hypothetical protein
VDGIFAKLRRRTMRGLAARFQIQPQASFVRAVTTCNRVGSPTMAISALNPLRPVRASRLVRAPRQSIRRKQFLFRVVETLNPPVRKAR